MALTSRHFGIRRQAFYRWKSRCDPRDLSALEDRSPRPRHRRQPTWTREQTERVRRLPERYPCWGKDKLVVLLRREGWTVSVSMVGRILNTFRQRGVLTEPGVFRVKRRCNSQNRPWALRRPRDSAVEKPGNLVELDTTDRRPAPGMELKQFTARNAVSRWDVIEVRGGRRLESIPEAIMEEVLAKLTTFFE